MRENIIKKVCVFNFFLKKPFMYYHNYLPILNFQYHTCLHSRPVPAGTIHLKFRWTQTTIINVVLHVAIYEFSYLGPSSPQTFHRSPCPLPLLPMTLHQLLPMCSTVIKGRCCTHQWARLLCLTTRSGSPTGSSSCQLLSSSPINSSMPIPFILLKITLPL